MTRTYVDAGVLIAATRGPETQVRNATSVIRDPRRTFVASAFLRLEVLPKARYFQNEAEVRSYEDFFDRVIEWADPTHEGVQNAERIAAQHGLSALDALHIAAAILLDPDELVTTEGVTKPIHRVRDLHVVAI